MNVVSPFDILAPAYDAGFTGSILRMQRERVWSFLQKLLNTKQAPLKVLEINCGTGEDAVKFATRGMPLSQQMLSAGMIEKAKEKLASHSYGSAC